MTWWIPLTNNRYATNTPCGPPTQGTLLCLLLSAINQTSSTSTLVLFRDSNARVGSDGLRFLTLWTEHQLVVTNTLFQLKSKHKTSWKQPRSKHGHLQHHSIVHQADRKEVAVARTMGGADCWTDPPSEQDQTQPGTPSLRKLNCCAGP